jgi:hypothetical protein
MGLHLYSNHIFEPTLKKNGMTLLTLDDYSCRTLFKENSKGIHSKSIDDIRDILDAFDVS